MSKAPKSNAAAPLSFEDALAQVEAIIERIERGEIGLEESLAEYEKGVQLIQHCRQIHTQAVQRVDDLTRRLLAGGESQSPIEGDMPEDAEP